MLRIADFLTLTPVQFFRRYRKELCRTVRGCANTITTDQGTSVSIPTMPTTGTHRLVVTDGVLSWEEVV